MSAKAKTNPKARLLKIDTSSPLLTNRQFYLTRWLQGAAIADSDWLKG
ncbi:hypothetical protein [Altericista sp. CCNU0014]